MSRVGFVVEGHGFEGWESAKSLSDEDRELVAILKASHGRLDPMTVEVVEERLRRVEGDQVPVCECGWRGYAESWSAPSSTERSGSRQHITHKHKAQVECAQRVHAADMAAAALRHAAEAWTGEPSVVDWLRTRAEHIDAVGAYDGQTWPT